MFAGVLTISPLSYNSLRIQPFLLAPRRWDISSGGTSAPQRQKFHTDDANQCLRNKSDSHGVPKVNLFCFIFLLVDYNKVLRSFANELQQNSDAFFKEEYILGILTVL